MLGLLGVQGVPVAALGWQRGGGLQLSRAGRRGAAQEAALGGVGDRDRGPAAFLVRHCFHCRNRNCTEIFLLFTVTYINKKHPRTPSTFISTKNNSIFT